MRVTNYEEVVDALRPYLRQYLQEQGINPDQHFKCINPDHKDHSPSACLSAGNAETFHCHGCHTHGNIFHAAHFLEKKPIHGPGFVLENLMYLAERYGIEVQSRPLTEEEAYQLDTYRAYADAAQIITDFEPTEEILAEIKRRNWPLEALKENQVGWVSSFSDFRQRMLGLGYSAAFLDDIDLGFRQRRPSPIFDKHQLIFTISDEFGRACGFAARNLKYDPEDPNSYKYMNSAATSLKCEIYRKSELLYGLNIAKKQTGPVYIVEGYADQLTAYFAGIRNIVAVGGTAFTDLHVATLCRVGCRDIVLALDGDAPGQEQTEKLIDNYFAGHKDIRLRVLTVPAGLDPDDFIREHGAEAWRGLPLKSAFEWRLGRFPDDKDGDFICEQMIPVIVNEPSPLKQETMCRVLSEFTGFSLKTILAELHRLLDVDDDNRKRQKEAVVEQALRQIKRNPDDAQIVLSQALDQIHEVDEAHNRDAFSVGECAEALRLQLEEEHSKLPEPEVYKFGPDLSPLEEFFEGGDLKNAAAISFGGASNVGKTNLMSKLCLSIAQYNPDVLTIYHSIDDRRSKITTRMAMQVLGQDAGDIKLNWLKNPNYYVLFDPELHEKHKQAYDRLLSLVDAERLVIKDMELGNTIAVMDGLLGYYRRRYPKKEIVYFLDNFHLLQDTETASKDDHREGLIKKFKNVLGRHRVTGFCTMEYTKMDLSIRPDSNNIKGSSSIIYEMDIVVHLYNDLHGKRHNAEIYHTDKDGKRQPTIELIFGKNKVNGFKGTAYLDMFPEQAQFRHVSNQQVQDRIAQAQVEQLDPEVRKQGWYWKNGVRIAISDGSGEPSCDVISPIN